MYKSSDFTKPVYKTGEIMEILNISYSTIKVYDKNGTLPIKRTGTGRRAIFREDLLNYLDSKGLLYDDTETVNKHDIIYARVSSHEQKQKGDLDRQAMFLLENVHDLHNPIIMKEVGSGLNERRRKLQELMVMVLDHKVSRVFVTYKDRLTRFGFHYLETTFNHEGVRIIVIRDEAHEKSVQEELVEDMMALIASFSGKLYGLRSGKNKKNRRMDLLLRTERIKIDIMKMENRELMEQMLMAIHAKDTLEMLEELIENSDTDKIDRKKLLDIIRRSPDMFFEEG